MATIGNLAVSISANTAGLTSGLKTATQKLGGFADSIGGLVAKGVALGAGLLGLGSAFSVFSAFDDVDKISKAAASIGITTEKMVGYQHAAELSGISTEALNKALQRATRQGMTLEEIADKMAAITDPTERAAFAYKTLGKSGQDLIPLLAAGGDALRAMADEGERLGGFSGIDADKVEEANDAISRMKLAFTGVAREIAIAVAPTITQIADGIRSAAMEARGFVSGLLPIVSAIANLGLATGRWLATLTPVAAVIGGIVAVMKTVITVQKAIALAQSTILALSGPKGWAVLAAGAAIGAAAYAGVQRQFSAIESTAAAATVSASQFNDTAAEVGTAAAGGMAAYLDKLHATYDEINVLGSGGGAGTDHAREMLAISQQLRPFKLLPKYEIDRLRDALQMVRQLRKEDSERRKLEAEVQRKAEGQRSRAAEMIESLKTPAQKVEDRISEIFELFQKDLLTKEQASQLSENARKELTPEPEKQPVQGPAALQAGSSEAFSAILSAMRNGGGGDPATETAKTVKEQLAEQKRQTGLLRRQQQATPQIEIVAGRV